MSGVQQIFLTKGSYKDYERVRGNERELCVEQSQERVLSSNVMT